MSQFDRSSDVLTQLLAQLTSLQSKQREIEPVFAKLSHIQEIVQKIGMSIISFQVTQFDYPLFEKLAQLKWKKERVPAKKMPLLTVYTV